MKRGGEICPREVLNSRSMPLIFNVRIGRERSHPSRVRPRRKIRRNGREFLAVRVPDPVEE